MCSHATSLFQINRTAMFLFQDFCFWGWGLSKIHWQEFVRGRISITVQASGLGTCIASADFPSDVLSFSVYTPSFCFISSYYHLWVFLPCVSLQFPSLLFTFLSFRCTFVSFQFVFLPGSWAMGSDQPLGVQSPSFLGKNGSFIKDLELQTQNLQEQLLLPLLLPLLLLLLLLLPLLRRPQLQQPLQELRVEHNCNCLTTAPHYTHQSVTTTTISTTGPQLQLQLCHDCTTLFTLNDTTLHNYTTTTLKSEDVEGKVWASSHKKSLN